MAIKELLNDYLDGASYQLKQKGTQLYKKLRKEFLVKKRQNNRTEIKVLTGTPARNIQPPKVSVALLNFPVIAGLLKIKRNANIVWLLLYAFWIRKMGLLKRS